MPIEVLQRLEDDACAQFGFWPLRILRQGGGVERRAKKFPPLAAVMEIQRELARSGPDDGALNETRPQRDRGTAERGLRVSAVEPVDAEMDPTVDAGANVDAGALLAGIEPADDFDAEHCRPPVAGAVDVKSKLGEIGHGKSGN